MWRCWMPFILAWVSMATPSLCQSGDAEWGSGADLYSTMTAANVTLKAAGDEPARTADGWSTSSPPPLSPPPPPPPPLMLSDPRPDACSVHFSTSAVSARRLKAQREELDFLQAVQHGNRAVMENLAQYVGAELGEQSYEDVIRENVVGIQEEHKSCHEALEKAEEDLAQQLEGDASGAVAGMQKIREESLAFEDMLRAAADIAARLEGSSRSLHAALSKQLRDIVKIRR